MAQDIQRHGYKLRTKYYFVLVTHSSLGKKNLPSYSRFLLVVKEQEKLEETLSSATSLSPPTPPTMAQQQTQPTAGSGILDAVPLFVVILLAAHVLALVRFPLAFLLLFRSPARLHGTRFVDLIPLRSGLITPLHSGCRCSGCTSWPPRSNHPGGRRSDGADPRDPSLASSVGKIRS